MFYRVNRIMYLQLIYSKFQQVSQIRFTELCEYLQSAKFQNLIQSCFLTANFVVCTFSIFFNCILLVQYWTLTTVLNLKTDPIRDPSKKWTPKIKRTLPYCGGCRNIADTIPVNVTWFRRGWKKLTRLKKSKGIWSKASSSLTSLLKL